MKNVTISMDEDVLQKTRVLAAEEGISVSRFLSRIAAEKIRQREKGADGLTPAQRALKEMREIAGDVKTRRGDGTPFTYEDKHRDLKRFR